MQNREDEEKAGRTPESVLTTDDLARPAPPGDRDAAVYPGEATGGRAGAAPSPVDPRTGSPESVSEGAVREPEGAPQPVPEAVPETWQDLKEPADEPGSEDEPLLGTAEAERYRTRWSEIQGRFVDDPQEAVRSADTLVAEVMQTFAGRLSEHRGGLEKQWDRGEQVATEDLRQALRAYRSLVNRLLDT
ncbi:hypothetical protein OG389_01315 [Streptomyces sp. NBC_00435]|uniref:hypothetical protein n=1 Tax=Streptomyces sp. NBC_00435 TaxID=2903649 RepID=UPI002E1B166B